MSVIAPTRSTRPRRRHRPAAAVTALATGLVLAACATPSTPPAPTNPFLGQQPQWGPCAPTATNATDAALFANPNLQCASIEVPLDHAVPGGERGSVALMRKPATGQAEGSLVLNPGGPGISGKNFLALFEPAWETNPIAKRFDIVSFDPRGVGGSTPRIDCYTDAEYDRGEGLAGGAVYELTSTEQAAEVARRCVEGSGGMKRLTSVGTSQAVHDLDLIRDALGDEKLTYLGHSYGTELGAMYATRYPDRVRAVVLDGVVSPDQSATDFRLAQFAGFQTTFEKLATACAATPQCPLGTDPAGATEQLHRIIRPLAQKPVPTADGRRLDDLGALFAVTSGLYAEPQWPEVMAGLAEVEAGRGDILMKLRDQFMGRGPDGIYTSDPDANTAIRCMDWPTRTPEEQTALAERIVASAPILDLGTAATRYHHECEGWPAGPTREEPWVDAEGIDVPPTLVVSVTGDPATPHQGGIAMAEELGGSLLTVDGNRHGAYMQGRSDCVDGVVERYFLDLELPPADTRCRL